MKRRLARVRPFSYKCFWLYLRVRCLRNWNPENEEIVVPAWLANDLRVQAFVVNVIKSSRNLPINR